MLLKLTEKSRVKSQTIFCWN